QRGLGGTVEDALSGRIGRVFAGQGGIKSALHQLLTCAGDGVDAGIQRLGDLAVAPGLARIRGVGLQQDACLQKLASGGLALLDQRIEPFTLVGAELYDVLLDSRLFRGHDASPGFTGVSIQKLAAESTTWDTSNIASPDRRSMRRSNNSRELGSAQWASSTSISTGCARASISS